MVHDPWSMKLRIVQFHGPWIMDHGPRDILPGFNRSAFWVRQMLLPFKRRRHVIECPKLRAVLVCMAECNTRPVGVQVVPQQVAHFETREFGFSAVERKPHELPTIGNSA